MTSKEIKDELEKLRINKQKALDQTSSAKSKYSTFGGDTSTCDISIPEYIKNNKI